jgi:hypothetical protein
LSRSSLLGAQPSFTSRRRARQGFPVRDRMFNGRSFHLVRPQGALSAWRLGCPFLVCPGPSIQPKALHCNSPFSLRCEGIRACLVVPRAV